MAYVEHPWEPHIIVVFEEAFVVRADADKENRLSRRLLIQARRHIHKIKD